MISSRRGGIVSEEFADGVRRLVESGDPGYRETRAERYESLECFRKLHDMSRIEMGELCLDYLSCSVCEESLSSDDDFDTAVNEINGRMIEALKRASPPRSPSWAWG